MEKNILKNPATEHFLAGTLLILFLGFPWLSRRIDAGAAALDAGALSLILMAILSLVVFKMLSWLIIRTVWPFLEDYTREYLVSDFNRLPPAQRISLFFTLYMLMMLAFVLTMAAIN